MKDLIYKYVLQNAVRYNGKANPSAIIGKVIAEVPELKNDMKKLGKDIAEVIKKVNSMSVDEQIAELQLIAPELLEEKKEEKKDLKDLPGAINGKFVTRIPPEPSKYAHIGHALSFLINYVYAKKYSGKCILRYEDTNPEKVSSEFVNSMEFDIKEYLGITPDSTRFVSDDMPILIDYAKKLVSKNNAYVCFCNREDMQNLRHKGQECVCRNKVIEKNVDDWERMIDGGFKEGECILRLKGDMSSDNHVMRDPVLFRIDKKPHYRQNRKYTIWPMYDFYNPIEDELCGVTYILRSNEFGSMRTELHNYLRKLFAFKIPLEFQYGRFNVTDKISQGREIRELIEQKKVKGWDDPRLVTLKALRRRGIIKETFYELVKEVGLSKTQTNLDFEVISSINRRFLDKECDRYFFINDSVKIEIKNAPDKDVELPLHPEIKNRGLRKFSTSSKFFIEKSDFEKLVDNKLNRFMECLNFIKKGKDLIFDSENYENFKNSKSKGLIMHYLPVSKDLVKVEILMDDGEYIKGIAEPDVKNLNEGDIIQFERFGFVRLETIKTNVLRFVF